MAGSFRAATALWLAVLLAQTAAIADELLLEAEQQHCSGRCGNQGATAKLEFSLRGSGAHRHLVYSLLVRCPQHRGSGRRPAAAEAPAPELGEVALLQPLPPAVFADVYQLENAARLGLGPAVKLFGPVDVESIERYSQPTLLAIYSGSAGPGSLLTLEVPLHARYPHPRHPDEQRGEQRRAGFGGWLSATRSAAAMAELPPPHVLARCQGGGWQAARLEAADGAAALAAATWDMPAGNLRHGPLVAVGSAAAMALGVAAVLLALFWPHSRQLSAAAAKKDQ